MAAQTKGDQRRIESITVPLTKDERDRLYQAALSKGLPPAVFARNALMNLIEQVAA